MVFAVVKLLTSDVHRGNDDDRLAHENNKPLRGVRAAYHTLFRRRHCLSRTFHFIYVRVVVLSVTSTDIGTDFSTRFQTCHSRHSHSRNNNTDDDLCGFSCYRHRANGGLISICCLIIFIQCARSLRKYRGSHCFKI